MTGEQGGVMPSTSIPSEVDLPRQPEVSLHIFNEAIPIYLLEQNPS